MTQSQRTELIDRFIKAQGLGTALRRPLAGDASSRRYERIVSSKGNFVLMDWPSAPDGPALAGRQKPYSAIAHIAESVHAFCAVDEALRSAGFSAPKIFAADLDAGFLLLEDFGDTMYGALLDEGVPAEPLYEAAVDALFQLAQTHLPSRLPALGFASAYNVPAFDEDVFLIEAELLIDWYWPAARHAPASEAEKAHFRSLLTHLFAALSPTPPVLMLRDFHSPNLMWLAQRQNGARAGLLDFQDALMGPAAYDLVSLLQDARRDVPEALAEKMLHRYLGAVRARGDLDAESFEADYAIVGAQRAAKILGIFCRLARRDRKPHYLAHIPRVWRYMTTNLQHPKLHALAQFLDDVFPPPTRLAPPQMESVCS